MMAQLINRRQVKRDTRAILRSAHINPMVMTVLYLSISAILNALDDFVDRGTGPIGQNLISLFVSIMTLLLGLLLSSGFTMYCMAVRHGEEADVLTLFDGFALAGKIIALSLVMYCFIFLWSLLFVIPGFAAMYRYRFALYNLYENPDLPVLEALRLSRLQSRGYKLQLMFLDLSFLPWAALAALPSMIYSLQAYNLLTGLSLSLWQWDLICILWDIAVSVFYLAAYHCTDYAYYEIAKATSGITPNFPASAPFESDDE